MYNALGYRKSGADSCVQKSFPLHVRQPWYPPPTIIFKPPTHKTKENLNKLSVRKFHPCFKVIRKQFTFYKIKPHFNLITLKILDAAAQRSGFRNPSKRKGSWFGNVRLVLDETACHLLRLSLLFIPLFPIMKLNGISFESNYLFPIAKVFFYFNQSPSNPWI
jgi:hypothetical protein